MNILTRNDAAALNRQFAIKQLPDDYIERICGYFTSRNIKFTAEQRNAMNIMTIRIKLLDISQKTLMRIDV